jgi:circadian clock protein KaiB
VKLGSPRHRAFRSADAGAKYELWLYIAGSTPRSTTAILNIMNICKKHLNGRYRLEIVDVFPHPDVAREEGIVATPTLVRKAPKPRRVLVGDLSDTARVLSSLEISPTAA